MTSTSAQRGISGIDELESEQPGSEDAQVFAGRIGMPK